MESSGKLTPNGHSEADLECEDSEHPYVNYLRTAMQREGVTPEILASRSGISKTTISFILNGKQEPSKITNPIHSAFATALRVPMYRLVERSGYQMFEGTDIPSVVVDATVIEFPAIRNLSDINNLPPEQFDQLFQLLERHAHRPSH